MDISPKHEKPLPPKYSYPSDYGLANQISALIRDYGKTGAINRLIEEAERLRDGKNHMDIIRSIRLKEGPHK
jgi:hypothetical protein